LISAKKILYYLLAIGIMALLYYLIVIEFPFFDVYLYNFLIWAVTSFFVVYALLLIANRERLVI